MTRILIVEEEALLRNFLLEELEDAGFDVVVATNADEAIVILENQLDIRLVYTEIDMPGSMNGARKHDLTRPPRLGARRLRAFRSDG